MDKAYRLLNVFTEGDTPFTGNPLCVFEDGSGLTTGQMQSLALQFNLSETTFIMSTTVDGAPPAVADVRIFTPAYEMPFAGHPTLGTAHVVRDLIGGGDALILREPVGDVPVEAHGDRWTLQAQSPRTREVGLSTETIAAAVGLPPEALGDDPMWVDTGIEQLIVPLRSVEDVRAAAVQPGQIEALAATSGETIVYVWAQLEPDEIVARMFAVFGPTMVEDPATGSACANLGGWLVVHGHTGAARTVHQGAAVGRPSVLHLDVDDSGCIRVSGDVRELGRGTVRLPI